MGGARGACQAADARGKTGMKDTGYGVGFVVPCR